MPGARHVVPVLLATAALVCLLCITLTRGPTVPELERTGDGRLPEVILPPLPARPVPTSAPLAVVPGSPVPPPEYAPEGETGE